MIVTSFQSCMTYYMTSLMQQCVCVGVGVGVGVCVRVCVLVCLMHKYTNHEFVRTYFQ